jgi:hypothetical protein
MDKFPAAGQIGTKCRVFWGPVEIVLMVMQQVAVQQLIVANYQPKVVNAKVLPRNYEHRTLKTRGQVVNSGFRHATVAMLQKNSGIHSSGGTDLTDSKVGQESFCLASFRLFASHPLPIENSTIRVLVLRACFLSKFMVFFGRIRNQYAERIK